MSTTATAYTSLTDSASAGTELGRQLREGLGGHSPDAAIVFASARFDYTTLLEALDAACEPAVLVGSSSAGEFTDAQRGEGTACAMALRSDEMEFSVGLGQAVQHDRVAAATDLVGSFRGLHSHDHGYRAALVMTDALAGHADDLVEQLTRLTSGRYEFAGGGAGDDAAFSHTHVFAGTRAYTDAVVALEILSDKPMGIGVGHGWVPVGPALRVTEVDGMRLIGLNGMPAVEAFERHAELTDQRFDRDDPLPFFLHNILGIDTGGLHRLRVPLSIDAQGAVTCAAEIPAAARVHIMKSSVESAVTAATNATNAALLALNGHPPGSAIFFDCVATRLRLADKFDFELDSISERLGGAKLVGCNTYGQIARATGQFGGFHNCTAVVFVLPA